MAYDPHSDLVPMPIAANVRYLQSGSPLPQPLAPFIGRNREIHALRTLIASSDARLLTLTGPGGVGKTRLAIQTVAGMTDGLRMAVHFVPLAAVAEADRVPSAVATALDVSDGGARPLIDGIRTALRDRPTLLILDNMEHVLPDAAGFVSDLLATCPALRILATSRSSLRIYGERRFPVRPLSVVTDHPQPVDAVDAEPDAIRLLIQRARSTDPSLVLGPVERRDIATICARLDGLPLAIELAAARVAVLSPGAFLHRLERRLPLSEQGARDMPRRQQTMDATVAWSYDLLDPGQQAMFRRLAMCTGAFDLALVDVLAAGIAPDVLEGAEGPRSGLELLVDLTEASLVQRHPHPDDEPRYQMLETIRAYGLDRLRAAGEEQDVRKTHAEYFLGQARFVNGHLLTGRSLPYWLSYLDACLPNMEAAMVWFEAHDPSSFVACTRYLMQYWLRRSSIRESLEWLSRVHAARDALSDHEMGWVLTNMARMRQYQHGENAGELYREALAIARRHDDVELQLTIHIGQVLNASMHNQVDDSAAALAAAMAIAARSDVVSRVTQPTFLSTLEALVAALQGDLALAKELATAALDRAVREQDDIAPALQHRILSAIRRREGELELSRGHILTALDIYHGVHEEWNIGSCLIELAGLFPRDHPVLAIHLAAAANRLHLLHGVGGSDFGREPSRKLVDELEQRLGHDVVSQAWREGASQPWSVLLEEATTTPVDASEAPPATPVRPSGIGGTLSPREHQVLRLIAEGMSDREIAAHLGLTYRTITTYVSNILTKLDAPSRAAAISRAARDGFLNE